tara:strand:- start:391 stop:2691 length:2301 start_codon:yes stop_codon:yes gene_type:complete
MTGDKEFSEQFNVDDYVESYQMHEASNTLRTFISDMRKNIRQDFSMEHFNKFLKELKTKATGGGDNVSPVQTAINTLFTIDGNPMNVSDLNNAKNAQPDYSASNYRRRLGQLKNLIGYEKYDIIPDGSIQTLYDKFEAESDDDGTFKDDMKGPNINLTGFFNKSGLFSGIDSKEREEMYKYWEEVSDEYADFYEIMDDFVDMNLSLKPSWNKLLDAGGNYIIPIEKKETLLPDIFNAVNIFIRDYLTMAKVLSSKGKGGAKATYGFAEEGQSTNPLDYTGGSIDLRDYKTDSTDAILDDMEGKGTTSFEVDPILLSQYYSNKQPVLFKESDLKSARRLIRSKGRKVRLEKKFLNSMERYFDRLEEEITLAKNDRDGQFYLPISDKIHDKSEVSAIDEAYDEFLNEVVTILMERSAFRTSGSYRGRGTKTSDFSVTSSPVIPNVKEAKLKDRPSISHASQAAKVTGPDYQEVLDIIGDYIIKPINSGKYFGTKPRFSRRSWFTDINRLVISDPYSKTLKHILNNLSIFPSDLDNIYDMLDLMRRGHDESADNIVDIKTGVTSLNTILGNNKENKELGGHIWWLKDKDAEYNGVSVESLHNDYLQNSKGKVFQMIRDVLESEEFRAELKIRTAGGRDKQATAFENLPITSLKRTWVHTDNEELLESAKKILTLLEEEGKTILSSFDLIMEAHDMIRKMSDKNIVYHHLSLDNIDSVDYILKHVPTYELNVLDLQQIVTDLDSFSNIAKAFGINEEAVYTIKGLCRGIY